MAIDRSNFGMQKTIQLRMTSYFYTFVVRRTSSGRTELEPGEIACYHSLSSHDFLFLHDICSPEQASDIDASKLDVPSVCQTSCTSIFSRFS